MKINIEQMTPAEIVAELDKFIIGQQQAKKRSPSPCEIGCAGIGCLRNSGTRSRPRTSL